MIQESLITSSECPPGPHNTGKDQHIGKCVYLHSCRELGVKCLFSKYEAQQRVSLCTHKLVYSSILSKNKKVFDNSLCEEESLTDAHIRE